MKNLLLTSLLISLSSFVFSQNRLEPGTYTSADGYYSFQIAYSEEGLQVIEPTRANLYRMGSDGRYYHSEPQYASYYIRVINSKELRTGKAGASESAFTWTGYATEMNLEDLDLDENCTATAEKYQNLAVDDYETQAWVFCAAAAMVKCMSGEKDFEEYAESIVLSLREIIVNQEKCPCEDVISPEIWRKYR